MKKKLVWLLAGVMMMGALAGCGGKAESKPEGTGNTAAEEGAEGGESTPAGDIEIGFSGDYLSDFMANVVKGVETAAADNGVKITVQDAEFDTAKQLQQVENFINAGMDAVVVKPVDSDACEPMKNACAEAGIPFIVVNSQSNAGSDVYVGSDHTYSGQLQGEFLAENLTEGGKVAILMGEMTVQASVQRTEGAKEAMKANDKIEVVSEQEAGWMRDEAMQKMENWLNSGLDLSAVIANNDEMAIGAAKVLKENGVEGVLVCGIDATEDALNMLKSGEMAMTVFQNGYEQGYQGVVSAVRLISGEQVEAYVDVPYEMVTAADADKYLEIVTGQ